MLKAVIFDLDGTVLDNEKVWEDVFRTIAKTHELQIESKPGEWIHTPGIGLLNNWKKIVNDSELAAQLTQETKKLYIEHTNGEAVIMDGLVPLVEEIKEEGWQTALATGSEWHTVEAQLVDLDLFLAFDTTTTGDEVLAQKPDPELYLLTAQKLGIEPELCIVIEDAPAGVESAKEAGCIVIGLTSERVSETELKASGADFVVDNLSEVMVVLRQHGSKEDQANQSN